LSAGIDAAPASGLKGDAQFGGLPSLSALDPFAHRTWREQLALLALETGLTIKAVAHRIDEDERWVKEVQKRDRDTFPVEARLRG